MHISLIIPCYNEELNIQKGVLDKIGNYTKNDIRFDEVLIVDDGSTDSSKSIIREKYLKIFPKFKLVENQHQGKAYAVITGIQKATSEYVIFSDMDLATPIEEAERLVKAVGDNYPVVIGSRSSGRKGAPLPRKIMAMAAIMIKRVIIGLPDIKDTQCGFKLFKRSNAMTIIDKLKVFDRKRSVSGSSVSAGFDMEFLFVASKLHYNIKEIPVDWKHVETKHVNFVKDSVEGLKDIMLIKYFDLKKAY